jgi:Subtilase family/Fervidolysin N-terminal prodomain
VVSVTDTRRRGAARRLGAWLPGLREATGLALGALLCLAPAIASAGSHHHHGVGHSHSTTSTSDDENTTSTSSSVAGGGNDNNAGSGASSSSSGSSSSASAGGNGNGMGAKPAAVVDVNPFNAGPDRPHVGIGFSNNGGSVSASIPLGVPRRSMGHGNDEPTHPKVTLPFARFGHGNGVSGGGAPTRAMAYGNSGGGLGGIGGGQPPELTNRLIQGVAKTFSNRFTNQLGDSLRPHLAQPATLANRSANAIVNDRFAGFGGGSLEPRVFTVPMLGETRYVPNQIVVAVPDGVSPQQAAAIASRHGLAPVSTSTVAASGVSLQCWRVADGRPVGDAIRSLQGETEIQAAQPNYRFRLTQAAGVSQAVVDGFSAQYAPAKLHLPQAHHLSTGQGVLVAVIDTGIDRLHPEIAGAVAGTFDAIGAREPPDAHGTAIAGAIIAHGRLIGAAPAARILAIRAFTTAGPDAEATTMTVVRSIEYAMAQGARVINMSFAGARDPVIGRSLAQARRKGIVLVAAAGNAGPDSPPLYPAADPNVIAVSATDVDDRLLDVANRGRQIAVTAPGVDVLLPAPGGRYQIATGTSFAAAHVAGIVALMLAKNAQLGPEQVRSILTATARDLGPKGRDDEFGAGLADAYRAVAAAVNSGGQTVASAASAVP